MNGPSLTAQEYALAIGPVNDLIEQWYTTAKETGLPPLALCSAILGLAIDLVDDPRLIDVLSRVFRVAAEGRRTELLAAKRATL